MNTSEANAADEQTDWKKKGNSVLIVDILGNSVVFIACFVSLFLLYMRVKLASCSNSNSRLFRDLRASYKVHRKFTIILISSSIINITFDITVLNAPF